nr:hypothetical protein Q903MT_gene2323 [Picea sitchensis]
MHTVAPERMRLFYPFPPLPRHIFYSPLHLGDSNHPSEYGRTLLFKRAPERYPISA